MSYTTIKALWPGEKHEDLEELRNAWGSAPLVWSVLGGKHLGSRDAWIYEVKRLFALVRDPDVPAAHRNVLMMTFERCYVLKRDYAKAASDIREFLREFPQEPGRANHWPRIAAIFESDPDIPAIGFHHTSIDADPYNGPWNQKTEQHDPTDWSRCWSIYDQPEPKAAKRGGD